MKKNLLKGGIALLLTFCLLFGLVGGALAAAVQENPSGNPSEDAGGEKLSYVAIGDSYSNGYGLADYTRTSNGKWIRGFGAGASPRAYPGVVAQALGADLTSLTVSGMRTGDFRYLLDPDYKGDGYAHYFARNIFNDISEETGAGLSVQFAQGIKGADLITFGLGVNDFGTYLSQRLLYKLGAGGDFGEEYQETLQDILNELPEGEARDKAQEIYNEVLAKLSGKAPAFAVDLANGFAYAYGAFVLNFAADMQIIRQLNPDAQIIVLSIPNQMKGVRIENLAELAAMFGVSADAFADLPEGLDIGAIGDMYGLVIDYANLYMNGYLTGTFDRNCAYADIEGFEIIYEALAQGGVNPNLGYFGPLLDEKYNKTYFGGLTDPDYATISEYTMAGLAGLLDSQLASRLGLITDGQITINNGQLASAIKKTQAVPRLQVSAGAVDVEIIFKAVYPALISITPTKDEAALAALAYQVQQDTMAAVEAAKAQGKDSATVEVAATVADVLGMLESDPQADEDTINKLYAVAGVSNLIWSLSDYGRIKEAFANRTDTTVVYTLGADDAKQTIPHNSMVAILYDMLVYMLRQSMAHYYPIGENAIDAKDFATLAGIIKQIVNPGAGGSGINIGTIIAGIPFADPTVNVPEALAKILLAFFPGTDAICSLYARYMMAEGVGNHPTPDGYEFMAAKILEAVEDPAAHKPSDEVAKAIAELMETVGNAAWKYAEDQGIVDAVNDLYNTVKDEAILPALEQIAQTSVAAAKDLDDATKDVRTALDDVIDAMQDVAAALADIESHADGQDGDELAAAEKRLTDLFATLDDKVQTLQQTVDNLDKVYQKYRDEVSNAYDDAKANILNGYGEAKAELETRFPAIAQNPNYPEIVKAVDAVVAKAAEAVDKGKAEALAALDAAEGQAVAAAKGFLAELEPYAEQISAAAAAKDPAQYTKMVVAFMEKGKEIYDTILNAIEFIVTLPESIKEIYDLMLAIAGFGFYTQTEYSKYVSIGDSTATGYGLEDYWNGFNDGSYGFRATVEGSYPYLIANALFDGSVASTSTQAGVDARDNGEVPYIQLGCGGLRVEDFRYLMSAEKIPEFNYSTEDGGHLLTDLPDDATVEFLYHELVARAAGNKNAYDETAADHWNTGKFAVQDVEPWTIFDDATYTVADSYDIDGLRAYYAAELADADFVTIQMGANNFATFLTGQLASMGVYEFLNGEGPECVDASKARTCQWDNYLDPQTAAYVRMTLDGITKALTAARVPQNIAEAITVIIESYAYGIVGYAYNLPETVNLVHELAPNAVVVVVGLFNTLRDGELDLGRFLPGVNVKIPAGDMLEGFINLTNAECAYYALQTDDTIYVAVNDATTFAQSVAAAYGLDLMDVYLAGLLGIGDEELKMAVSGNGFSWLMHEDYAGHEYIMNQILDTVDYNGDLFGIFYADLALAEDQEPLVYTGEPLTPHFVLTIDSELGPDVYTEDDGYFSAPEIYKVETVDEDNELLMAAAYADNEILVPVEEVIDAGLYRAFVTFEDDLNDSIVKTVSVDFTVAPAPVTVTWTDIGPFTFDSNPHAPKETVTVDEGVPAPEYTVEIEGDKAENGKAIQVGDYTARVVLADPDNYVFNLGTAVTQAFTISSGSTPSGGGGGGSVTYKLTLADTVNGTIDFVAAGQKGQKSINVEPRTSVKVEVKPAAHYVIDKVTYTTQANSTPTALYINADGYYVVDMPSSNTTVTATFKPENDNDASIGRANIAKFVKNYLNCNKDANCLLTKFRDLVPKEWYHDGIHFCLENAIMQGFGTPDFLPDGITTRAQVVTTLWNIAGHPIKQSSVTFRDVKSDDWFYEAIMWAAGNGIVVGYGDGSFGPNDAITHEQMAKIFYGYAKFLGYDVSAKADISKMDGANKVTDWAVPFVEWAVGAGICCGKDGNTTSVAAAPLEATRAELAAFILDFCVKVSVKLAE